MEAESGTFRPNEEVDEIRWVDLSGAARLLSYDRDRELLVALAAAIDDLSGLSEDDGQGMRAS
jgi:8-oxo-dGTP diphosphatase